MTIDAGTLDANKELVRHITEQGMNRGHTDLDQFFAPGTRSTGPG